MHLEEESVLYRFHRVLVQEFRSRYQRDPNGSLTVSDIYYDLVPFQARQDELGFASVFEYEHALLRLLAGQGGFLEMESLADRQKVQRYLDSRNPDSGLISDFLSAGVRICSAAEEMPLAEEEKKDQPHFEERVPLAGEEKKDLPHFEDCPSCSEPLPQKAGVRFCPFCGSDLRRVLCVSCDEELRLDWRFCVACGTGVEPQKGPNPPH